MTAPTQARVTTTHDLPAFTSIERHLYAALDRLGVKYRPQYPFPPFRPDAYLPAWAIVLEADGDMWHGCRQCGFEDDAPFHERKRVWRDRRLLLEHRVLVIHLWGHDLETDEMAYCSVVRALRPYCGSADWARKVRDA